MTQDKPKRSFFDRIINAICVLVLIGFVVNEFSHLYRTLKSIDDFPDLYQRRYTLNSTFPFVGSYFLMAPQNYDPRYKYPLVIVLHGVSNHAYAAESLSQQSFRNRYPFFVMVPIAPKRAFWATPQDKQYQMARNIPYPDHLPHVISGIKDVSATFQIDPKKIFIVGHSMGGSGVFGALERYPDVFAAGVASAGAWSPLEVSNINDPLLIFHGAQDQAVPVQNSLNFKNHAKHGSPINVKIINRKGHDIGRYVSDQKVLWDWMLSIQAQVE